MELFPALVIGIVAFVMIIIIIVAVVVVITGSSNNPSNSECASQTDCPSGFVCTYDGSADAGICKSGVGSPCNNNDDCSANLTCVKGTNSSGVCIYTQETIQNMMKKSDENVINIRKPTRRVVVRRAIDNVTLLSDIKPVLNVNNDNTMVRKVIPKSKRIIQHEITSTDNEENSSGDLTDTPFDVRSGESTESTYINKNIGNVSTPCHEKDGVYYCRANINEDEKQHSSVIDVCSYSSATVFLLQNGNIICEISNDDGTDIMRHKASNNIMLKKITSFNGYLHGLGVDNKLYILQNNYFLSNNWIWNLADWTPINIVHISTTHDSSYLWIQTKDGNISSGLLYNNQKSLIDKNTYSNTDIRRIYGKDINNYIEIDSNKHIATVFPGNKTLNNIYDAALSYYDEVIAIHPSESNKYKGITIVNWNPYYIHA